MSSGRRAALASVVATLLAACGSGGSSSLPAGLSLRPGSSTSPIRHVVLIVQENRSFDNLFALFPGANGATRGKEKVKKGGKYVDKWVKLESHALLMTRDIQHCHHSFETGYDHGQMDGFNLVKFGECELSGRPAGTAVYQYVQESDVAPYWDMAQQYVLADEMFQTQGSGSFTAHQDLIRGGTAIDQPGSGSGYTESLVDTPDGPPWGCDAPSTTKTKLITIYGKIEQGGPFPCSNDFPSYASGGYKTLRDLLDAAGVSWKYYTPCFSSSDGCKPNKSCPHCDGDLLNAFDVIYPVRYGPEWSTNISMPETNIFTDITNGALPAVSWVIPEDKNSDHPGNASADNGPSWVASVVNAIGESPYWNSAAIVILWDDWGGFYDNAKPPFQDQQGGLGFRVPTIVVSPYAIAGRSSQGGYISHTKYEYGSILKYIEENFNLGSLGTTDKRATSIGNVFNYSQQPRSFTAIPSVQDAHYFITHREPVSHGDPE
jgi:phospholipase C